MYIHEAIESRTDKKPYITRKSWDDEPDVAGLPEQWIALTNLQTGCLFLADYGGFVHEGWKPSMDDLIANDWEPVGP